MTFFRAKIDAYDQSVDRGVVKLELLTDKERELRVPNLPNSVFETVVIPKSKTYYLFGARFEVNRLEEQLSNLYYEVRSIYFSCKYAGSGECKGCERYQLCDSIVTASSYLLQAAKLANSLERKNQNDKNT